jgi:hypothetical protein
MAYKEHYDVWKERFAGRKRSKEPVGFSTTKVISGRVVQLSRQPYGWRGLFIGVEGHAPFPVPLPMSLGRPMTLAQAEKGAARFIKAVGAKRERAYKALVKAWKRQYSNTSMHPRTLGAITNAVHKAGSAYLAEGGTETGFHKAMEEALRQLGRGPTGMSL